MELPKFFRVHQAFSKDRINDVTAEVGKTLAAACYQQHFKAGEKIAITVGSRGIANIAEIIKAIAVKLTAIGVRPFIVPAMGSHGGATAAGQVEVLASLGITEDHMGVPIVSSMDVVELGRTANGATAYMDRNAWGADGIVIVNRVKPHTRFKADNESGLMKMIAVGLGKEKGCTQMHAFGLYPTIVQAARLAIAKTNIRLAVGIVENSYDQTALIKAAVKEKIEAIDSELLKIAKSLLPRFPLDQIHLLVVKEMGKNISGTGMDVNLLGRVSQPIVNDQDKPRVERIIPLSITAASHGNALGIGLGDVVPRHLVDEIDWQATYKNVIAAGVLDRAKLPLVAESDQAALQIALQSLGLKGTEAKIIFIRNTLTLDSLIVSEKVSLEIKALSCISLEQDNLNLKFDVQGNIPDSWW